MNWKRPLVAAAIFVLALILYLTDQKLAEKAVYQTVVDESLAPGINKSEVVEVRLRNSMGELRLSREGGQWRIKTPVDALADPETVDQLLVNITGARKRNEFTVKNLAEYGLKTPQIELEMKTESGKTFTLLIGNESTYTGQVFAAYPRSQNVFTAGEHVKNTLLRNPHDYRRTRLLDIDTGNLAAYDSLTLAKPSSEVVLTQNAGRWRIIKPIETPADSSIVEDYFRKAGLLRASGVITETTDKPTSLAVALQALTSPTLTATLVRAGAKDAVMEIAQAGEPNNPIYVGRRGGESEVLSLRPEAVHALDQDQNYFRSRVIFSMRPEDIGLLTVELGRLRFDVVRTDKGRWEFVGDNLRRVDQEAVAMRIEGLLKSRIGDYVDLSPRDPEVYGLKPPRITYTLISRDKSRSETIETGRSEAQGSGAYYARRRGDPSVFTIDLSPELIISPDSLADRRFARTDVEQTASIQIEMGANKYSLLKEGGVWSMLRPSQTVPATIDALKVQRFFDILNGLEFDRDLTASKQTVITPNEPPSLVIRLLNQSGDEMLSLSEGRRLKTTTFVSGSGDRLYEVGNVTVDRLNAALQSLVQ
ncbi:MAG: DUF4340 domain-containing protein [bacterium]|nr:DUF4340 domain-containing protein [Candidatus Sumerlaeota bacterium]